MNQNTYSHGHGEDGIGTDVGLVGSAVNLVHLYICGINVCADKEQVSRIV
jgi:hypothetical protein